MDIISELNTLKADHSAAQTLLDEAKQAGDSLSASLATAKESIKEQASEIEAFKLSVNNKDKELATLKAEVTALKGSQKSAEQKAVEIVANVGIKPMAADYSAEKPTKDRAEVIAGIHAIKDPIERAKYYFAHKAVLFPD